MMDDIVATGPQAQEDTAAAMMEAGLMPGFAFRPLETEADVEALHAECRTAGPDTLYICRVSRASAEKGLLAGAGYGLLLAGLPENVRGRVALSFDGWAEDPRGLWQVPAVVGFCNGLIYGPDPMSNPDPAHPAMARAVLPVLIDEESLIPTMGAKAWDVGGRNFVISIAHATFIFDGTSRDAGLARNLYNVFMGNDG